MKTYYDSTGKLIHIGEWDYAPIPNLINAIENTNPIPMGVVVKDEEVKFEDDGTITVVNPLLN
jgi:hypothetical protein